MVLLKKVYQKNSEIVTRKIDNEVILVPIKRKIRDVNAIYLLQDNTSKRIWELVDGKRNIGQIKDTICKEFDVNPSQAEEDIVNFIKELEKIGVMTTS